MTVKELKEYLKSCDDNMEVRVSVSDNVDSYYTYGPPLYDVWVEEDSGCVHIKVYR